jgi:hypothetical protein
MKVEVNEDKVVLIYISLILKERTLREAINAAEGDNATHRATELYTGTRDFTNGFAHCLLIALGKEASDRITRQVNSIIDGEGY